MSTRNSIHRFACEADGGRGAPFLDLAKVRKELIPADVVSTSEGRTTPGCSGGRGSGEKEEVSFLATIWAKGMVNRTSALPEGSQAN